MTNQEIENLFHALEKKDEVIREIASILDMRGLPPAHQLDEIKETIRRLTEEPSQRPLSSNT